MSSSRMESQEATCATENEFIPIITEKVIVANGRMGCGFNIFGGKEHTCMPFGATGSGIFISKIDPFRLKVRSGNLRMGDRVLKMNGEDMTECTFEEARKQLLKPIDEIILTVQHNPLPEGYQKLKIVRAEGEKFGLHVSGGVKGFPGNPLDHSDEGVFISKIKSGGAAERDGRLKVGMRLLEVNDFSMLGSSHCAAWFATRWSSNKQITLVVCKGYDKEEVDRLLAEGKLSRKSKSASNSFTCLDMFDEEAATIGQPNEIPASNGLLEMMGLKTTEELSALVNCPISTLFEKMKTPADPEENAPSSVTASMMTDRSSKIKRRRIAKVSHKTARNSTKPVYWRRTRETPNQLPGPANSESGPAQQSINMKRRISKGSLKTARNRTKPVYWRRTRETPNQLPGPANSESGPAQQSE